MGSRKVRTGMEERKRKVKVKKLQRKKGKGKVERRKREKTWRENLEVTMEAKGKCE